MAEIIFPTHQIYRDRSDFPVAKATGVFLQENERNRYLSKCFAKDSSIVSRKIADEFFLVPIRQTIEDIDSMFVANEVAGRIWELIDGEKCVEEIRDVIVEEFEVTRGEAETDLVEFLQQLADAGVVREV